MEKLLWDFDKDLKLKQNLNQLHVQKGIIKLLVLQLQQQQEIAIVPVLLVVPVVGIKVLRKTEISYGLLIHDKERAIS